MSKLVCLVKEITEGVNRLELGQICPDSHKPSPYPYTIAMSCDLDVMPTNEASNNGCPKYEVDVDVKFDENSKPGFNLVSGLIAKQDINLDERYIKNVDASRKERYKKEVDSLVLEKLRKQLNDPYIEAIVTKIKEELPK